MAQTASYEVRMIRPDRTRAVIRRYFDVARIPVVSSIQLAGFLTHKLFADTERGGAGTFYTITERVGDSVQVYTVRRTSDGRYVRV